MSQFGVVQQTKSEEETLTSRGYRLLTKLGEGSYAKVNYLSILSVNFKLNNKLFFILGIFR